MNPLTLVHPEEVRSEVIGGLPKIAPKKLPSLITAGHELALPSGTLSGGRTCVALGNECLDLLWHADSIADLIIVFERA
jgi:hypothetical protein